MAKIKARDKLLDTTFEEIYIHGYSATSIDAILQKSVVPKGSLYHHFGSKKSLVLSMVEERLFPKMDMFFIYEKQEGSTVLKSLRNTFVTIAKNRPLVKYGCPLYRLMVELSPVDKDFDKLLVSKYHDMHSGLKSLLQQGIDDGEFSKELNVETFCAYTLSSVWGILSLPPSLSSSKNFITQSKYILDELEKYKF